MVRCSYCGEDELLPFTCPYCGGRFCSEHRLPERHACIGPYRGGLRPPKIQDSPLRPRLTPMKALPLGLGRTEALHLALGVTIFFAVEASRLYRVIPSNPLLAVWLLSIVALAYGLHELAHKLAAQGRGLSAEFRIDVYGAALSLFTVMLPLKFVAPGAIFIYGYSPSDEQMGRIAIVGPLVNLAQSVVFGVASLALPWLALAAVINADLALFNLFPISLLDGRKVFVWDRRAWALAFLASLSVWAYSALL